MTEQERALGAPAAGSARLDWTCDYNYGPEADPHPCEEEGIWCIDAEDKMPGRERGRRTSCTKHIGDLIGELAGSGFGVYRRQRPAAQTEKPKYIEQDEPF